MCLRRKARLNLDFPFTIIFIDPSCMNILCPVYKNRISLDFKTQPSVSFRDEVLENSNRKFDLSCTEVIMLKQTKVARIVEVCAVLFASSVMAAPALARKDAPLEPRNNQALTQEQVKQLAARVGSYKNGEPSRQENLSSVGTKPDQGNRGDQDVSARVQPNSRVLNFAAYGK